MDAEDQIDRAGDFVEASILGLHDLTGIPMGDLLAGGHSVIMGMIVQFYGTAVAADCLQRAAEQIRAMPPSAGSHLAIMPTKGRAQQGDVAGESIRVHCVH